MKDGGQQITLFNTSISPRSIRSIVLAVTAGMCASLVSMLGCFLLAGAGHGSFLPAQYFYGPLWAWWQLRQSRPYVEPFGLLALASLGIALYGLYGGVLALARLGGFGRRALVTILVIHYAAVAWVYFISREAVDFHTLGQTALVFGMLFFVSVFEFYVFLHVLAFQYASSTAPFRPRLTRSAYVVLLSGIVVGVALYACSVFAPPPSWYR